MAKKIRLIAVDDELHVREDLQSYDWAALDAELLGCAESAAEAAEMIEHLHPDLVLCDISMPGTNGLDLLKAQLGKGDCPIFAFLTGYDDFTYAKAAIQLGALEYILKLDICEDTLRSLLQKVRSSLQKENVVSSFQQVKSTYQLAHLLCAASAFTPDLAQKCREAHFEIAFPCDPLAICVPDQYAQALLLRNKIEGFLSMYKQEHSTQMCWLPRQNNIFFIFLASCVCSDFCTAFLEYFSEDSPESILQTALLDTLAKPDDLLTLLKMPQAALDRCWDHRGLLRIEVEQALDYIADHLEENLTLESVAPRVGLSASHFSRIFHQQTGETFNDFLTHKRISCAVHLLETTNLKVYEVAEKVGFPKYRYFTTVFKSVYGKSPRHIRRNL